MKPEAKLWQVMKAKLALPADRLDRIENSFGSGYPDVQACIMAEDAWIELKAPREPARAATHLMTCNGNHPLLESQINWFIRQRQAGGIAFILVRTNKRMMLIEGTKHAEHVNDWTVSEMIDNSLFVCSVPTKHDDWRMLRNVIFTAARYHRLHQHTKAQQLLDDMERARLARGGVSR